MPYRRQSPNPTRESVIARVREAIFSTVRLMHSTRLAVLRLPPNAQWETAFAPVLAGLIACVSARYANFLAL
jgi:hypothetical protein